MEAPGENMITASLYWPHYRFVIYRLLSTSRVIKKRKSTGLANCPRSPAEEMEQCKCKRRERMEMNPVVLPLILQETLTVQKPHKGNKSPKPTITYTDTNSHVPGLSPGHRKPCADITSSSNPCIKPGRQVVEGILNFPYLQANRCPSIRADHTLQAYQVS